MRMTSRRRTGLLELSEMRLPLIALIDVILFLLMYFLLAGSMEAEERELAATLGSGRATAGDSGGSGRQR
jgi:biopolymer transport protein ExbD